MKISGVLNKERFIALSIDSSIAIVLFLIVMILLANKAPVVTGIALVAVYLGYFIVFEGLWSRTPGKYYKGLIVRKLDGARIGWKEAVIRGLMIFVEVNPLFLGGLPAAVALLSSERKQRFGDMLAGTVVVSDKLDLTPVEQSKEIPDLQKPPPPPEPETLL